MSGSDSIDIISRMKLPITIFIVVVVAAIALFVILQLRTTAAELTPSEAKIRDLVRERFTRTTSSLSALNAGVPTRF